MTFGIIIAYLCLLLFLGLFAGRLMQRTSGDFFLASRGIGPFMLLMSVFGTTMTAFALIGSTGKAFEKGIGVYGLMASWSGIVHAAIFFLIGVKVWALGKKHGYVTQIAYFRDRFQSDGLALLLFPVVVSFVLIYILMGVIGAGKFIENITPETFSVESTKTVSFDAGDVGIIIPALIKDRLIHDAEKNTLTFIGESHPKWRGAMIGANAKKLLPDNGPVLGELKAALGELYVKDGTGVPSGAVPYPAGMALICIVVLFYVFFGGMRATAWANTFQTLVFMVMGLVAFVVITKSIGGPVAATEKLLADEVASSRMAREGLLGKWQFLTYVFIPLSVGMFPHLFQHWLTAKKASNFKLTVVAHPLCILVTWIPCILLGMWAAAELPLDTTPNAVLGMMVSKHSGTVLAGLIGAGVLAAIMSSMDSQFLCLSSLFTNDIVAKYFGGEAMDDRKRIFLGRAFVLVIVLIAYVIGYFNKESSVFDLGVWCFTGFSGLSPILFAALYWKRVTKQGAIAAVVCVAGLWLAFLPNVLDSTAEGEFLLFEMMPVTLIVAASTATLVIVSLLTPKPPKEIVDKFFGE